ncbi:CDP-glycerol glycerophosphotransferase family protein [Planomicrobium sp. Y74]|uniref:CDP-glycerol glycerophosphotransferase family protein n=1 Tax=Planomicrobium sp. Y74 TaxID=2478977 RepID=UPI000EF50CCE|nr:CDP-glycerol glycerophosphotransferase family protein [Planomicrobium sp. Y74]RLQ86730.1 teichoic acid biosynthesis protein [Planomicrobium sp. Y74]
MIGSRTLKRVRNYLVKKAEAERHYLTDEHLVFEFSLTNFLFFNEIHAEFWNNEEHHPIDSELTEKDKLKVYIPLVLLETIETGATVKVFINNKAAWLTAHPSYKEGDFNESLLINERYLTTRVKKNLQISNRFSEFRFSNDEVFAEIEGAGYDRLELGLDLPAVESGKPVEIYAFKNRQFIILHGVRDRVSGNIRLQDFSELSMGIWRLFAHLDDTLHPLRVTGHNLEAFSSLRHRIRPIRRTHSFYLEVRPNAVRPESIQVENLENRRFRIMVGLLPEDDIADAEYALLLDDQKSGRHETYPFVKQDGALRTEVPLEDLIGTLFAKRFFLLRQSEEPKVSQFLLDMQQLSQSTVRFKVIADSQHVKLRFYKRKDKSLGLKITRPKLRKAINDIDGFRVDGSIGSTDEFINATAYLMLEDRFSLESRQVPIHDNFSVDVEEWNLIGLKSKDKTIFDFFVVVETDAGEVIRKEKIKYRKADYKKDAFYSYRVLRDEENNEHHFMFTTTPFNNLKIETFTLPADIQVPADVSVKDPNVWLVGERSNTAQDNGIVLFHWLIEHTDVEAYYVIEEDSLDYEPIQHMKNVLVFGSPEHFEVAFRAGVLLCTHDIENILPYKPAHGFFGYENTKKIFLQHGVLGRKNVEYHKRNYELPFDLFIVSSDPEKEAVVMEEMGYSDEEVAVTGLARFDRLVQNKKPRDILLMPTWRDWINTDEAFLASEYYLAYTNLIQNEKLLRLLDEHNINLNFYPHYRAQNYFQNGIRDMHERIKFIPLGSVTVQRLLIRHALLITDYSTVSFDFTLLDKPVVFYHFDAERFFRRGILRPLDETFIGGIASHEEELVSIIEDRILHDFANFNIDISGIIKYQDQDNCRRIYESVRGLLDDEPVVDAVEGELDRV